MAIPGFDGRVWLQRHWNDSANWNLLEFHFRPYHARFFKARVRLNNTNNIANLTLDQIRFNSGGFNLYGDAFTLTNDIVATNASGVNTINNSVTNGAAGLASSSAIPPV